MSRKQCPDAEAERMIEKARAMVTADLLEQMLRERSIDPDDLETLLDLVALGLTNGTWRNSCVENWHAEGRLSDGDMLRVNSHTTQRIRQRLRGWSTELRLTSASKDSLAEVTQEDADTLAVRLFKWTTNPERMLPTGLTLRALAGTTDDYEEYKEHADRQLSALSGQMESKDVRYGLLYTGVHGALACHTWWGHPEWPRRVERFLALLDNPADPHWGPEGGRRRELPAEPAAVQAREALRSTLLKAPWELDAEVADWITSTGIGYLTVS